MTMISCPLVVCTLYISLDVKDLHQAETNWHFVYIYSLYNWCFGTFSSFFYFDSKFFYILFSKCIWNILRMNNTNNNNFRGNRPLRTRAIHCWPHFLFSSNRDVNDHPTLEVNVISTSNPPAVVVFKTRLINIYNYDFNHV